MSLLTLDHVTNQPLTAGDAGIILKEDGTFRIFNLHENIDPQNVTDTQKMQMKKLMALAVALQVPQVMDLLYECASDPEIVGSVLDLGQKH